MSRKSTLLNEYNNKTTLCIKDHYIFVKTYKDSSREKGEKSRLPIVHILQTAYCFLISGIKSTEYCLCNDENFV